MGRTLQAGSDPAAALGACALALLLGGGLPGCALGQWMGGGEGLDCSEHSNCPDPLACHALEKKCSRWTVVGDWDQPFSFTMGEVDDEARLPMVHVTGVTLTTAFEIRTTELTEGELRTWYETVDRFGPLPGAGDLPAERASWHHGAAYCNQLSREAGYEECFNCDGEGADARCQLKGDPYACRGYRLPTEAEWEYAARGEAGGDNYADEIDSSGDVTLDDIAWHNENSGDDELFTRRSPSEVGQLLPNAFRLYDALGNVGEWCLDSPGRPAAELATDLYYSADDRDDASMRVVKGGYYDTQPEHVNFASHTENAADSTPDGVGFRLVRSFER